MRKNSSCHRYQGIATKWLNFNNRGLRPRLLILNPFGVIYPVIFMFSSVAGIYNTIHNS